MRLKLHTAAENNGTIYSMDEEAFVSVSLKTNDDIDEDAANGLAKFIATAVGNKDTSNITIMDYSVISCFQGNRLMRQEFQQAR